jgi:hypothetical protein
MAIKHNYFEIVELFVQAGAETNNITLTQAILRKDPKVVEYFLQQDFKWEEIPSKDILQYAIDISSKEIVKLLLQAGFLPSRGLINQVKSYTQPDIMELLEKYLPQDEEQPVEEPVPQEPEPQDTKDDDFYIEITEEDDETVYAEIKSIDELIKTAASSFEQEEEDIKYANIKSVEQLIKISTTELLPETLNTAIDSLMANEEFKKRFINVWKDYYSSYMPKAMLRAKYRLDKDDTIPDSVLNSEITDRFSSIIEAFKEEAGSTKEEIIYYIMGRAWDFLDPCRYFFIYLAEYFGGIVENGKLVSVPDEWDKIFDKYNNLDELFQWAYEQEYGTSFIRNSEMTADDVKKIKNEILNKYKHLIGDPIPIEKEETKPFHPTFDVTMGKRDIIDPKYEVE